MKDIKTIQISVDKFAKERDWDKFHSPKNLAMALSVETAELMEHFQWLTEQESYELDPAMHAKVADEIADVQVYLARLADKLNIDIATAVSVKMDKNRKKYPADIVYGSAKKYNEYKYNKKHDE
ncbi:MAG: nucleotide pyrophosphohydrolase [Cellvibrionaceae bacterium]